MALFYAAIRRDSVSLLRFPFLSHVHIFSGKFRLFDASSIHTVLFLSISFLVIVVLLISMLPTLFKLFLKHFFQNTIISQVNKKKNAI